MILLVGATGDLGGHVARQLRERGAPVRAMTRDPARAAALRASGVEVVQGDVRDPASLRAATKGVRAVVSASHAMLGSGKGSVSRVDDAGQRNLIHAARESGVAHFVFASAQGASLSHPVDFWRTKAQIEGVLRESGLGFTIIRPGAFMALHAFALLGKPVLEGKRVLMFGPGTNPKNFIAAADVAKYVLLALDDERLRGETLEIGGPENLSSMQIVALFERIAGRKARITHLPLPALRMMSHVLQPVHSGVSRVLKASIVGETTDQTFDASPILARFPITPMSLEDFARAQLAHQSPESHPNRQAVGG